MDREECILADWRLIGYEDGAAGKSAAQIGEHREACADHGVRPDMEAYRRGRADGLREYCRPQRAYRLGRQGAGYSGVCPDDIAPDFAVAYEAGRKIYSAEASLRSAESHLRTKKKKLEKLDADLISTGAEIARNGTSLERRAQLVGQTLDLANKRGKLEAEISELKVEVALKRDRLNELTARNSYH